MSLFLALQGWAPAINTHFKMDRCTPAQSTRVNLCQLTYINLHCTDNNDTWLICYSLALCIYKMFYLKRFEEIKVLWMLRTPSSLDFVSEMVREAVAQQEA